MSHLGILYLDWVNWETYCCEVEIVWSRISMVRLEDAIKEINTLDVLENLL